MVTRKTLTAAAVALSVGLLARHATSAEPPTVQKAPIEAESLEVAATELFRDDIEGYVRELDRFIRATLDEELRRELGRKIVLATDELRTKT